MSNIPYSVANSVLDELETQPINNLSDIKKKLQYDLYIAKQKVSYFENELNKINELIIAEHRVNELKSQLHLSIHENSSEIFKPRNRRKKQCYQKNKGKPCNKLLENGKCKYCN
jgi:hypothetical protein